jgi:hypothetical protein
VFDVPASTIFEDPGWSVMTLPTPVVLTASVLSIVT